MNSEERSSDGKETVDISYADSNPQEKNEIPIEVNEDKKVQTSLI